MEYPQATGIKKYFPFLSWFPLTKNTWKDDLIAGFTNTIIVIPQAVAFAMIAGLPPIYGFYTAMITPIIAALFGSSFHLISGPTTAISIVVYATISSFADPVSEVATYVELTLILTFMAGVIQFMMGVFKMGNLVNFVSQSVILGFTAGAGVLIAFKQLKHVFGIPVPQGSSLPEIVLYIGKHIGSTNLYVLAVALGTLGSALIAKRFLPRFYMLIAMIIGSIIALLLGGEVHGIELVGDIPSNLPPFRIPNFTLQHFSDLLSGALAVALLGLIQAIAIAKAIALHSHQKIDSNQEFIGQGLSNMISSFFSSYAGSGSFTRSGVNYQSGGKTPLTAIFAAIFLAVVLIFFGRFTSFLPKSAMGGIILLVGYNLIDFKHIAIIIKSSYRELIILAVTMLGTMFIKDLEYALLGGIVLSFIFYMEKTSRPHIATIGITDTNSFVNVLRNETAIENPAIKIVRLDGSLYFGALESVSNAFLDLYRGDFKYLLVISHGINFIDLTGAEWLEHEAKKWKEKGGGLYFSNMNKAAQDVLIKGGFKAKIGEDHFFEKKRDAMEYLKKLVE